uniref:Uncharacterized protein n=1 Tax=Physcomitrium patens TaxID=3218 RepID=A0A2K1IUE3_PHYPA|nr:hypothetical protein PHYPA_024844 [Physcomitrium patens]
MAVLMPEQRHWYAIPRSLQSTVKSRPPLTACDSGLTSRSCDVWQSLAVHERIRAFEGIGE